MPELAHEPAIFATNRFYPGIIRAHRLRFSLYQSAFTGRPTPATIRHMAAGIIDRLWSLDDVIAKIDEMAPPPAKRGPYKKWEA